MPINAILDEVAQDYVNYSMATLQQRCSKHNTLVSTLHKM